MFLSFNGVLYWILFCSRLWIYTQKNTNIVWSVQHSCLSLDFSSHVSPFQAQNYQALVDELHEKRLQLSLAELYHNEKTISTYSDTLIGKQQAASIKNDKLLNEEQKVKACKKEHGRLSRELQHIEKEIRCVFIFMCRANAIWSCVFASHLLE